MALTTVVYDADSDGDEVWHVDDHGNGLLPAPSGAQRRLCVLTATTAADLLTLIGQAHGLDAAPDADTTTPRPLATVPPTTLTDRPVRLTVLGELSLTVNDQPVGIRRTRAGRSSSSSRPIRKASPAATSSPPSGPDHHRPPSPTGSTAPSATYAPTSDRGFTPTASSSTAATVTPSTPTWSTSTSGICTPQPTPPPPRSPPPTVAAPITTSSPTTVNWPPDKPGPGSNRTGRRSRHHVVNAYTDLADSTPAAEAIELLREAITVDPYNDHLHHRAVDTLIDLGDHTAATRLHDIYLQRLTTAGLQPSSDTRDLANRTSRR